MLCAFCRIVEVPRTGRPGRPARYCSAECRRGINAARQRVRDQSARRPADFLARHGICRCGRDYLTVPLEDAHLCIDPGPVPC